MFRAVCRLQWKASFTAVALIAVAGFIVPLLAVQRAGFAVGDRRAWDLVTMLAAVESAGSLFQILAIMLGLTLSVSAWSADHQGDHVYALTLPVPRWYYVLLRFGAGVVLILPVTLAVGLGCALAIQGIDLPAGLRSYGTAITLRFALAALVAYAATFALAAGTKRTAALILGSLVAVFAISELLAMVGVGQGLLTTLMVGIFARPGPFEILAGPWTLIGV
ncbi:MAG: hypothetical protein OEY20_06265 [Gemmatimonadota bacterium]|nr:hypothetical protein [Gemmatimonadota bacterium]MDH5196837.1 hypothetical protein [Gemmatimonadota bacterium]